jgi:hypothetical protein
MTEAQEAQNLLLNRTCDTCIKDCKPDTRDHDKVTCSIWKSMERYQDFINSSPFKQTVSELNAAIDNLLNDAKI